MMNLKKFLTLVTIVLVTVGLLVCANAERIYTSAEFHIMPDRIKLIDETVAEISEDENPEELGGNMPEKLAEEPIGELTETSVDGQPEELIVELPEEHAEELIEDRPEEPAEELIGETTETSVDGQPEELIEELPEGLAEELIEDRPEEPAEEPIGETTETSTDEQPEESAEEPVGELTEDPAAELEASTDTDLPTDEEDPVPADEAIPDTDLPADEEILLIDIREEADGLSPIIGQMLSDEDFIILQQEGTWVQIQYGETVGYVFGPYIGILPEHGEDEPIEKKVTIFANKTMAVAPGDTITLTSYLEGFDDCEYVLFQWECNKGNGWVEVPGATEDTYSFIFSDETNHTTWRLRVISD